MSQVSLKDLQRQPLVIDTDPEHGEHLDWHGEKVRDRVCNHLAVALLGLTALLALCVVIGSSSLLNSIAGRPFSHCPILVGVGAGGVIEGCVLILVLSVVGWRMYKNDELSEYGACMFPPGQSKVTIALRIVVAGVLPAIAALITLGLTIGSIALFTLSTSVAPIDQSYYNVAGVDGAVSIIRDVNGLTHINASSRRDALFGQGFAQAQDRLWQLEFNRLAARGRLAEFVGNAGLHFDKQTRTLNIVGAGKSLCQYVSVDERALMQSFVDGINYYLDQVNERPPEFMFMSKRLLFFHDPEPFTVEDVCLSARLLQWQLSYNVGVEIERFKVFWRTNRSYAEVNELYTNQTNISHTVLNSAQLNITEADCVAARARESNDNAIEEELYNTYFSNLRETVGGGAGYADSSSSDDVAAKAHSENDDTSSVWDFMKWKQHHASNAWAARAAGAETKACGASDPHLDINLPSVWYFSHLTYPANDSSAFDTSGVGMVGIPGCHICKTTHVAWGITMSLTDLEDLFYLVPDPANPDTHYMVNGVSTAFVNRVEVISVKGGSDVVLTVQDSLYGPVATEALGLPKQLKFAIWANPLREDNSSITTVLALGDPNEIRTVRDLRDRAFGLMQSPGFSIPMQDAAGNVGYTMTGYHVLRAPGHTGRFPTIGNGTFDYRGSIPFNQLPTLIQNATMATDNGQPMMVSAANQKIYPDGYKYTLGYDYVYPYRGGHIQSLLSAAPAQLSNATFHQMVQSDITSNVWSQMKDILTSNVSSFQSHLDAVGQTWFNALVNVWDGRSSKGSGFPSFFFLWMRTLSSAPSDAIHAVKYDYWSPGDGYPAWMLSSPTPLMIKQCGALTVPPGGDCGMFAAQAFNTLAHQYASVADAPVWGSDLNVLTGTHLMMHGTILQCMFERSIAKDGDYSSIDVSDFASTLDGAMSPRAASSMRQLYSWATPSMIRFALPGGESGNPYSSRYDNLLALFGDDTYVPVLVEGAMDSSSVMASQSINPGADSSSSG